MNKFSIARKSLAVPLFAAISLSMIHAPVNAADYPQRAAIAGNSAKYGLGVSDVALLRRDSGPGASVRVDQLLKQFSASTDPITTRGIFKTERGEQKTNVIGEGWSLSVFGDGSRMKYRNYAYLDGPNNKPLPLTSRLSQDALEKLGRNFVATKLGQFAVLGRGEALIPYFTQFQVGGGGSTEPGVKSVAEEVFANTVIFARSVNGIPVLGPGSKIAVIFANDGQPVGFDLDWSSYQVSTARQKAATLTDIQSRAKKVFPFDLSAADTKTTRFECGYFDLGARKRDVNAPIQTACLVHANKRQIVDKVAYSKDPNSGHTVAAYMSPVPAGATIERDTNWPEALLLLGIKPTNTDVPPTTRLR
ncbi:MAG: hypothetical protein V4568_02180 [Pseudomonadota bacterium]